jgi:hypothetical protein
MESETPYLAHTDGLTVKPQAKVQLLPPLLHDGLARASALAGAGIIVGFAYFYFSDFGKHAMPIDTHTTRQPQLPKLTVLKAEDYPGSMTLVDRELAIKAPYTLDAINMPLAEKQRLKTALEKDRVRVGAITLWDNVAEDGDAVEVAGAGYSQKLTIMNHPTVYFVPFQPGGTIRITGLVDGGGGITLGVRTALGSQNLPPLAPGEILELQIP